ncbi:hypothetical protein [Serratia proteamaculans]|uniref:hypothetical protein n=1 Tax=Serratia proteamaculans TaxID=28151 RepID=UPI0010213E0B|nr:hypothetical protein [Serratia proteamaculans]RYM50983.1 hypothetical protein BSQ97_16690 [Serratia proteamaculans]
MDKSHFLSLSNEKDMNLRFVESSLYEEQLSCVLIVHLVCERIIERWIESASNNKNIFNNVRGLSFSAKLQIANNFGTPEFFHCFCKVLNNVRNKFAHEISKTKIDDEEMNKLESSILLLPKDTIGRDLKTNTIIIKGVSQKYIESTENVKLVSIFGLIYSNLLNQISRG